MPLINNLSILFCFIGVGFTLAGVMVTDQVFGFGILGILTGAIVFILNWKNGLRSLLVLAFLLIIFGTIYLGKHYVILSAAYMAVTFLILPLVLLFLGCAKMNMSGTFKEKIKHCLAYIVCIVSIWLGNFLFVLSMMSV